MRTIPILLLAVTASLPAFAEDIESTPTVSVSGTATTRVEPDLVIWNITTTDENQDLKAAKASSDEKLRAILGLARELDVAEDDVQTGYVSIDREYDRDESGNRREFRGYAIRRGVTIQQRDLSRFDEYLDKLVASADMEANFRLTSSKMEEIRWDTRLKAVKLAKDKAEAMAGVVDAALGPVLDLSEYRPGEGAPMFQTSFSNAMFTSDASATPDAAQGTFAPGNIEITVTVHARFALE